MTSVAVIGAGLGGVAAAVNLVRRGVTDVTILEQSDGPGGTWWDNHYPGAECDVPSHLYSFSFLLSSWSRSHAGHAEIQQYVERVIDRFGLRARIRFGTRVDRVLWQEEAHGYRLELTTADGPTTLEADVVVSAVGLLNVPRYPEWAGLSEFAGPVFHTARWEHEHDLTGKRVAVVGAGSSAAQVVPALAPVVKELVSFQREPAWVVPKNDHEFTPARRAWLRTPVGRRLERLQEFRRFARFTRHSMRPESPPGRAMAANARAYLGDSLGGDADLATRLLPAYPLRCKRVTISSTFLPTLTADNVQVVTRAVTGADRTGLLDDEGGHHPVDAVVLATGFQPWNFLAGIEVVGPGGRTLHGTWGDEPEAFLGLAVPGFPNLFLMYGPNTNCGVITFMLERQAEFVARQVVRMRRRGIAALEVRPAFHDHYRRRLAAALATVTTWEAGCHNYYHSASGKNVTQWPWTQTQYALATRLLRVVSSRAVRG